MRNLCKNIIAISIMTATFITPLQANAQSSSLGSSSGVTINQGDRIAIENKLCTAGYIDKENNRMITAAHCGNKGEVVYKNSRSNKGQRIGVIEGNPYYNKNTYRNDFIYVKLDPGVTGENIYSGDKRVPITDVSVGDRFCSIGQMSPISKCGVVKDVDENIITTNREGGGIKGDSGGPGWIPGKGFVGVYSFFYGGENKYPTENHRYNGASFTYPENGGNTKSARLNTGDISFPAPKIVSPEKAQPITPVTTSKISSPETTSKISSPVTTSKISSPVTDSQDKKDSDQKGSLLSSKNSPNDSESSSSTGKIIGMVFGVFSLLGVGSLAYSMYRENSDLFDINYWIKTYLNF